MGGRATAPRAGVNILDELEKALADEDDVWGDRCAWQAMGALPALIRVARAAEKLHRVLSGYGKTQTELEEALQQLRDLSSQEHEDEGQGERPQ